MVWGCTGNGDLQQVVGLARFQAGIRWNQPSTGCKRRTLFVMGLLQRPTLGIASCIRPDDVYASCVEGMTDGIE